MSVVGRGACSLALKKAIVDLVGVGIQNGLSSWTREDIRVAKQFRKIVDGCLYLGSVTVES
jgi:hypothetical protein